MTDRARPVAARVGFPHVALCLGAAAVCAAGCRPCGVQPSVDAAPTAAETPPRAPEVDPAAQAEPAAPAAAPVTVRVRRTEGPGASVSAGDVLSQGTPVRSGEGRVVLDFSPGARVELERASTTRVGELAPQELLVGDGVARADLPPSGNSPRPPLRLATAAGVVVVPGAGDVVVAALPGGRAWVAVLGGSVQLSGGALDDDGRPVVETLVAGRARLLQEPPAESTDAPTTLEQARALAEGLRRAAQAASEPAGRARREAREAALEEALVRYEGTVRDTDALRARQRELARTDPPAARALLPELVTHSQRLLREGEALTVCLERFEAEVLGGAPDSNLTQRATRLLLRDRAPASP